MSVEKPAIIHHGGADSHVEGSDYLAKRQLKKGTAGWVLLAGLGVSYDWDFIDAHQTQHLVFE